MKCLILLGVRNMSFLYCVSTLLCKYFSFRRAIYKTKNINRERNVGMRGTREMLTRIPGDLLEGSGECYYFNIPGNVPEDSGEC